MDGAGLASRAAARHPGRALAALLIWLALATGCSSVERHRPNSAVRIAPPPARAITAGPGRLDGRPIVCLAQPLWTDSVARADVDATSASGDVAAMLADGLGDICLSFRDGDVSAEEYAAALNDYPLLLVEIAAYDAVDLTTFLDRSGAAPIGALIAHNRALATLCKTPRLRALLGSGTAAHHRLARWCPAPPASGGVAPA